MRYLMLFGLVMLPGAACNSNNPPTTNEVVMRDFSFAPESLNVSVGDTVTWVNNGAYAHTTTSGETGSPDGKWNSGSLVPGVSFEHVFTEAGNYHYYCSLHGATYNMKGVASVH